MNSKLLLLLPFALLLIPAAAFAGEASDVLSAPKSLNLTHHIIGYLSIAVTFLAYIAAMSEEVIALRKSKPMVLGSALVWFVICIYYVWHGEAKVAAVAFESNLLAYIELFLFILVSMTYLNAMEARRFRWSQDLAAKPAIQLSATVLDYRRSCLSAFYSDQRYDGGSSIGSCCGCDG
jgi:heme/copper-type cytochrome/quinol oxidase subunit 4